MKTIFFLSDSYTTHTLILNKDILFDKKVKSILVLKECCNVEQESFCDGHIPVVVLKNIDECISQCDSAIIDTSFISQNKKQQVIDKLTHLKKDYYEYDSSAVLDVPNIVPYKNTPNVLVIAIGKHAQHIRVELMLSKVFQDIGTRFKAIYSSYTSKLLDVLKTSNCINNMLSESLCYEYAFPDIIINCIEISDIRCLQDNIFNVREYSPDFVIVSSDVDFDKLEHLNKYLIFGCSSKIDMITKSHYHTNDHIYTTHCNAFVGNTESIFDIEEKTLENAIKEHVLYKLAYPKHVKPIY